ncbi:MAG: RNA 2',3'-cyclic phosphodiesterase [Candidatus Woesearchaeota archaeon]|nr:RNA 2',3'-cyclic phosphodiesterase [Candidatus Woesearchaeota archaeon]
MRLFVAIDASKEAVSYFFSLGSLFPHPVDSFHLTLKFLGEADPDNTIQILEKIRSDSFELELDSLGAFPTEGEIKVVWIGLKKEEKLMALQKKIDDALPSFRKDFDFHPHITLARPNTDIVLPDIKIKPLMFKVVSFKLYQSTLTDKGPKYSEIRSFSLDK